MGLASLLVLVLGLLAPQLIAALALQGRQSVTCDFSTAANSGDTCSSFASAWGLTVAALEAINPGISCPNLAAGQNYCVIGTATTTTSSSSSSIKTTTTSTSTSTTTSTSTKPSTSPVTTTTSSSSPEPTQSGLAANCNNFHLVASGDTCSAVESQYGITAADFSSWNPTIDSSKPHHPWTGMPIVLAY